MRNYNLSDELQKILRKIVKKDKVRFEATLKKIEEVISTTDVNHYKTSDTT